MGYVQFYFLSFLICLVCTEYLWKFGFRLLTWSGSINFFLVPWSLISSEWSQRLLLGCPHQFGQAMKNVLYQRISLILVCDTCDGWPPTVSTCFSYSTVHGHDKVWYLNTQPVVLFSTLFKLLIYSFLLSIKHHFPKIGTSEAFYSLHKNQFLIDFYICCTYLYNLVCIISEVLKNQVLKVRQLCIYVYLCTHY